MIFPRRKNFPRLMLAGFALLTFSAQAGNPLWNGAGSVGPPWIKFTFQLPVISTGAPFVCQ